jgi:hypothetical protein
MTSNVTEPSVENLHVEAGEADISHGDSTASVRENHTDKLETNLARSARNDIKIFKNLRNRRIVNVSEDFQVFEEEGRSRFNINLRIPKGTHDDEGQERKLRVGGELESTNRVSIYCPRDLRISFF